MAAGRREMPLRIALCATLLDLACGSACSRTQLRIASRPLLTPFENLCSPGQSLIVGYDVMPCALQASSWAAQLMAATVELRVGKGLWRGVAAWLAVGLSYSEQSLRIDRRVASVEVRATDFDQTGRGCFLLLRYLPAG